MDTARMRGGSGSTARSATGSQRDESSAVDHATDALYLGTPEALRALHDAVAELTHAVGDDVRPRATAGGIAFVRDARISPFLLLAPVSAGALRVGLWFGSAVPDDPRLRAGNSPTTGTPTHWVDLDADAVDADVITLEPLIEAAYEQNEPDDRSA